jgi:drug/metabolite transporter (DMT)-like permease
MVLVTLLWSTAGVVTRQLESARSFELTFWRSAFTALSLALILPLWQGAGVWQRMRASGRLLWLGRSNLFRARGRLATDPESVYCARWPDFFIAV